MVKSRKSSLRIPLAAGFVLALFLAGLCAAFASPSPVTITLREEPGVYTGCQDTFLNEYNQDGNYGDYDYLGVEHDAVHYQDKTTLIYFNLSGQIPSNACIKQAKLKLYQYDTLEMSGDDWLKVGCYRLLKSWDEGTGGTENGATWLQRKVGTSYPWARIGARRPIPGDPGTDPDRHKTYNSPYSGVVDDAQTCTTATNLTYRVWDVTPSVQYWQAHPSANYGMVLDKWWEASGGYAYDDDSEVRFRSRQYATVGERPVLEITYVVPTSETPVDLRVADLTLNYWDTDPSITFSNSGNKLLCSGTTSDAIWGADGSVTSYTINSSFESSAMVKLQQGIVGAEQAEFGVGLYQPGTSKYIRLLAVGFSYQYYEISGLCAASGNAHYHDGSAYWSSYWDDDYPTGAPSAAARFFTQTPEDETTTYLTWKIRYDKSNGMFYVFVNDVLVTYYSKVDFTNWKIAIIHDNNRQNVPTTVWTDFPDTTAPTPDPMTWATAPYAASTSSISMTASTATDWAHPPVSYLFTATTGGGHSSSWQSGTPYTDNSLSANTQYGYKVKARDSYSTPNETVYSSIGYAYTLMPTPTSVTVDNIAATSARLTAVGSLPNLNQGSSGILFQSTVSSPWVQTNPYTISTLTPNTQYSFKVKARNGDAIETGLSAGSPTFRTLAASPLAMGYYPVGCQSLQANWGANGNPPDVEYYCREATTGREYGWTTNTSWILRNLTPGAQYRVEVKARNANHQETNWVDLGFVSTNTSIGMMKKQGPVTTVSLMNKVVTAVFDQERLFFIQDFPVLGVPEGVSGVGVRFPKDQQAPPQVGQAVDVIGARVMNDPPYEEELLIDPMMVMGRPQILPVFPCAGNGKILGGGVFGLQPGVYDQIVEEPASPSHGLNYVGMLVQAFGAVRETGDLYFYIDDGSGLDDGQGHGIRVDLRGIGQNVPPGQYAMVTGIMRCKIVDSPLGGRYNVRELWPRRPTDIIPFVLPP